MNNFYLSIKYQVKSRDFIILFLLTLAFLSFGFNTSTFSQEDCTDNFRTEILEVRSEDDCVSMELAIYSLGLRAHGLSHFNVELSCGEITRLENSNNWPVETYGTDPTTGIKGFKIDDIQNFGEDGKIDTFYVSYSICSESSECLDSYQSQIRLAYKAGNCVFYDSIDQVAETRLEVVLNPANVKCYGGSDGSIAAEVLEGVPPYTFLWSTGETGPVIENLEAGIYSVIVKDSTGNSVEASTEVLQPESPLNAEATITPTSCSQNTGEILVTPMGGTGPYEYKWDTGDTTSSLSGLEKGVYLLSITDQNGCQIWKSYKIEDNSDLEIILTPNYLECFEEGQGEITTQITGGTEPYDYRWSSGETTQELSGVNSGLYKLEVTDSEGCKRSSSAFIGIRSLSISAAINNPSCHGGDDGEIEITGVRYGTPPYTYLWSTADTTAKITGLEGGQYEVTVTDSLGCMTSRSFTVSDPPEISLGYSVSSRDCSTDSEAEVFLQGTGGNGSFEYYLGDSLISSPVTLPGSGTYEILIRDSKGCEGSASIHIESPENLSVAKSITQPSCDGPSEGIAILTVSGGSSPYTYSWSDGYSEASRTDIEPGEYRVEVSDANGCTVSGSITIKPVSEVLAEIYPPDPPLCNTYDNVLNASSVNATNYSWEIQSVDNSWHIIDSSFNQLTYFAAKSSATIIYEAWNEEGCQGSDTLVINCTADNGSPDYPEEPEDPDTGDGDSGDNECLSGCWDTEILKITPVNRGCYRLELLVQANSYTRHDLSHLVVGLEGGYIANVYNSANYRMEINMTDPRSGIHGFKIDDISGFGYNSSLTEFTIEFEVCYPEGGSLPEVIPVVYKAGTCSCSQELSTILETFLSDNLSVTAYPNPFHEEINIKVSSPKDKNVEVSVYDLKGNKVAQLYKGIIKANVNYSFPFTTEDSGRESFFIYKVVSDKEIVREQILKLR
jgi:hypothetical protein